MLHSMGDRGDDSGGGNSRCAALSSRKLVYENPSQAKVGGGAAPVNVPMFQLTGHDDNDVNKETRFPPRHKFYVSSARYPQPKLQPATRCRLGAASCSDDGSDSVASMLRSMLSISSSSTWKCCSDSSSTRRTRHERFPCPRKCSYKYLWIGV